MLRITNLIGFGSSSGSTLLILSLFESDDVFHAPIITGGVSYVTLDSSTMSNVTLSGGDFVVTNTGSGLANMGARVANAFGKTSGKFYFEATLTTIATGGGIGIGVGTIASSFSGMGNDGTTGDILFNGTGQIWTVGSHVADLGTRSAGDVAGFAIDMDNLEFWVRKAPSGSWNNNGSADPATNTGGIAIPSGTMVPFVTFYGVSMGPGNVITMNFGASSFVGAVPAGITAGWTS